MTQSWIAHIGKILDPSGLLAYSIVPDEEGNACYELFNWFDNGVAKPTEQEFFQAVEQAKLMNYITERLHAYPSTGEQLDTLFHEGYEGWRASIKKIKEQYPKPNQLES
jgi:hypothetical protein